MSVVRLSSPLTQVPRTMRPQYEVIERTYSYTLCGGARATRNERVLGHH
jgi:hypothetical protein